MKYLIRVNSCYNVNTPYININDGEIDCYFFKIKSPKSNKFSLKSARCLIKWMKNSRYFDGDSFEIKTSKNLRDKKIINLGKAIEEFSDRENGI